MTPLLLGGGARGGGEKYGRNLFKICRTLLIHPTPGPSPYRGGEYCGKSAPLIGAGSIAEKALSLQGRGVLCL